MILLKRFPEVAAMDCAACQIYQTDELFNFVEHPKGSGKRLKRPRGIFPPCRYPQKGMSCPKGTPEEPRSLSPMNEMAYRFHKECEAVVQWPDDALVRRNAALIRAAEEVVNTARAERQTKLLEAFLGVTASVR